MTRKQTTKTPKAPDVTLTPDESSELQLILDRLAVQTPNGESFSNWLDSLKRSLEGRQSLIAALLQKLSRHPGEVGLRVFVALQGMVDEKRLAKAVRQAAYRFAQRGYEVGPPPEAAAERVILVPPEARASAAHMAVGSSGYVFLTALLSTSPAAQPVGISAYFENSLSRLSVRSSETSPKLYREYLQNVSSLFAFPLCEIPVRHAALLFREMTEWAGALPVTAEARLADQLFRSFLEPERPPYVHELMAPIENPQTEVLSFDVEPLFNLIPAEYLVFSREEITPLSQRIRDLESSVLVIPQELKMEQAEASIRSTIERLCTGARREQLKRLFEEMALWLKLSRQETLARSSWTVAQHIDKASSLGENPLLQQLVYLSLRKYWPDDFKTREELEEDSRPYQETDSGLILLK
jgi:hypothetical protein